MTIMKRIAVPARYGIGDLIRCGSSRRWRQIYFAGSALAPVHLGRRWIGLVAIFCV